MSDLKATTLAGRYAEGGAKQIVESGEDPMPTLIGAKDGQLVAQCFMTFPQGPNGRAMQVARAGALMAWFRCDNVALMTDAFVARRDDHDDLDKKPLPADDPEHDECLVIIEAELAGAATWRSHIYYRKDGGVIEWEPEVPEMELSQVDGVQTQVFQAIFTPEFRNAFPHANLKSLLEWLSEFEITVAFLAEVPS